MPLNANAIINDPNYVPLGTENGDVLVTDPGSNGPNGTFIIVRSTISIPGNGHYPHENLRSWLIRDPRFIKR